MVPKLRAAENASNDTANNSELVLHRFDLPNERTKASLSNNEAHFGIFEAATANVSQETKLALANAGFGAPAKQTLAVPCPRNYQSRR